MPEYFYLVDFECPGCRSRDEDVEVPKSEYDNAIKELDGWLNHTCSKCGCDFKQCE